MSVILWLCAGAAAIGLLMALYGVYEFQTMPRGDSKGGAYMAVTVIGAVVAGGAGIAAGAVWLIGKAFG